MRRLLQILIFVLALGLPAWILLVEHSPAPRESYPLDIATLRQLAGSLPGDKPVAIRVEHIMDFTFAEAMVMAGEPWKGTAIPIYSYQLQFPDSTLIVDSAMARAIAKPEFLVPFYDDDAYARLQQGLSQARQIVITHEHMDHIGGIADHPQLSALKPALRLTPEQLGNPAAMKPAELPAGFAEGYSPLRYEAMTAIAPGVVLIRAPGHTPGSQMVYVQRADGRELLLLGDVCWQMRNIDAQRERPLFMTLMLGEQRQPVLAQFAALKALREAEPALRLMPGHDGAVMQTLLAEGLVQKRFVLADAATAP